MDLAEVKQVSQQLIDTGWIDFLDISLWDSFKMPVYDQYTSESILSHYGVLVIPTLSTYMVEGKEGALFLEINQVKLTMLERENKKVL